MGVETPIEGIWSLNENWPLTGESRRQGDDHLRLIKDAILKTFAAINQPITATDEELNVLAGALISTAELNYLQGVTENIQDQINSPNIARLNQLNVFTKQQAIKHPTSASINFVDAGTDALGNSLHGFMVRRYDGTNAGFFAVIPNSNLVRIYAYDATGTLFSLLLEGVYGAKKLALTATDLFWGGDKVALQNDVDVLQSAVALKTDFFVYTGAINSTVGVASLTIDTGFGTTDFVYGISYCQRTDGISSTNLSLYSRIGTYVGSHQFGRAAENYSGNPATPSVPTAGRIALTLKDHVDKDSRGIQIKVWARKNI